MSDNRRDGKTVKPIFIALGANLPSLYGMPGETFGHTIGCLQRLGFTVNSLARIYETRAIGPGLQKHYYNSVVVLEGDMPPARLLMEIKRIERNAGRKLGRTWGPRCLDIDILDYKGRILPARTRRRERGSLVLPHPHLHERAFVLIPLLDVAPAWRHPVLGKTARALLTALPAHERAGVGPGLAFPPRTCEKAA